MLNNSRARALTPDKSANSKSLAIRTTIGVIWLMGTRLCVRSLGLISTIVLARLLIPEDFGIIALSSACMALLNGATRLGFNAALIKFQTHDRDDLDTAWTLNMIRGLALALLVLAASHILPSIMKEPRLQGVLQALCFIPLIQGLRNTAIIGFEKDLDYTRIAFLQVVSKVVAASATIGAALLLQNYWAFIIGMFVGAVMRVLISFIIAPHMPRLYFRSTRKLFDFSIWLSLSHFVGAVSASIDKLISGTLFQSQLTGFYYMGQEIAALLPKEIFQPLNRALFPGLAKFSHNHEKLRANALEGVAVLAGFSLPIGIGFAFTATEFVPLVLGQQWLDIIPMVQMLAPVLGLQALTNIANATLLSLGMTRTLLTRSLCALTIRLPLLFFGAYVYGFQGLIVAHVTSEFIYFLLNFLVLAKALNCKVSELFLVAKRSFISVFAMSLVLLPVHLFVHFPTDGFLVLAGMAGLKILVGIMSYTGLHYILWRRANSPQGIEARVLELVQYAMDKIVSAKPAKG